MHADTRKSAAERNIPGKRSGCSAAGQTTKSDGLPHGLAEEVVFRFMTREVIFKCQRAVEKNEANAA
jgi:hypothetical protein